MRLNPAIKAYDQLSKISSRLSFQVKPRDLQKRISSYPYLCPDTYLSKCERVILTPSDLKKLIGEKSNNYKTVYLVGDLINQFIEAREQIPNIQTLVIGESDTTQREQSLSKLYSKVGQIFSNNLIGKSERCSPVPLGIERKAYRSAGRVRNFQKKYQTKTSSRTIPFLIAWNDATNAKRPIYRAEFQNHFNSLVINQRVAASTIHKLMRKTMFVPSPAGNGIDCHRTWEALYLGAVPVVLRSEYFGESNWPVLVVDSWSQLIEKKDDELKEIYLNNVLDQKQAIQFGVNIIEKIFGKSNEQ
jgi:hypothetical protein